MGTVAIATRWGPWAFSDGVGYIALGRNLLLGRGLGLVRASGEFHGLSLHPPLYPLVLAGLGSMGLNLELAARLLNVVLFGATVGLAGYALRLTGNPPWVAAGAALAVLLSPLLIYLYSGVLSEPLFFVLILSSLLGLLCYMQRGSSPALVAAAVAAGLSVVTRYPGVAMLVPGATAVLLRRDLNLRSRLTDALEFAGLTAAPSLVWLAWTGAQSGADPVRLWRWDFADLVARAMPVAQGLAFALWDWLPISRWLTDLPQAVKSIVLGMSLIGAVALALVGLARWRRLRPRAWHRDATVQLILLLCAFAVGYLGQLTVTYLFTIPVLDPSDVDRRILAPILVSILMFGFAVFGLLARAWPSSVWPKAVPVAIMVILAAGYLPQSVDLVGQLNRRGAGYTGLEWRVSETLAAASELPVDTPIITNESAALLFWLDRPAYDFPTGANPGREERFGDGSLSGERLFREEGAALVLFGSAVLTADAGKGSLPEGLLRDLEVAASLNDGAIYFYPRSEGSN